MGIFDMHTKILYFDVETTGLFPHADYVTQLSGLIEIDGEVVDEFNYFLRPPAGIKVSREALEITGKTIEDLRAYPEDLEGYRAFQKKLEQYVDPRDRFDKFTPAAYNGQFDLEFMNQMFKRRLNSPYWGSYQNWQLIDPLPILRTLSFLNQLNLSSHNLVTVCRHFGIPLEAHDALSDIRATRELVQLLKNGLKFDHRVVSTPTNDFYKTILHQNLEYWFWGIGLGESKTNGENGE